jgi:C4-dicarboxylate-specific signal transduction histidine kinase
MSKARDALALRAVPLDTPTALRSSAENEGTRSDHNGQPRLFRGQFGAASGLQRVYDRDGERPRGGSFGILRSSWTRETVMATEMRKTGIDVVGEMPWGSHFCLFYETKHDLLEILVSYCKAGLLSGEFCLWVVAEPLTVEQATAALKDAVPAFDRFLADSSIEIVSARDWYLQGGTFELERVTAGWHEKLSHASARGYVGVRVTGDTAWLAKKDWKHFCEYEEALNEAVANQRLAVLCTYPLAACGALEILDVVRTHQFALARRRGDWDLIETAGVKQAKAEVARLNEELEQRVEERTTQLLLASEALREAQTELAYVNRVTTMGQLAASIAHEINQPIAAIVTNAQAALRFVKREPLDLEEVCHAMDQVVLDGKRAGDVIDRIRALIKKVPPRQDAVEINELIREVLALARGELVKHAVSAQTQLSNDLPLIEGDRVQLQQVILNLVMNAVEAMSGTSERPRDLLISTGREGPSDVFVAVEDSGPGFNPESFDRLFHAFYTTKRDGLGMGLAICRSIIEAHGGRVWASPGAGAGAQFQFTLPVGFE